MEHLAHQPIVAWHPLSQRLLGQLPVLDICDAVFAYCGHSTLYNCTLVCRAWSARSLHALYSNVCIRHSSVLLRFLDMVSRNGHAHLARMITFEFDPIDDDDTWRLRIHRVPLLLGKVAPRLRELLLRDVHSRTYYSPCSNLFCRAFSQFSCVTTFTLEGSCPPPRLLHRMLCGLQCLRQLHLAFTSRSASWPETPPPLDPSIIDPAHVVSDPPFSLTHLTIRESYPDGDDLVWSNLVALLYNSGCLELRPGDRPMLLKLQVTYPVPTPLQWQTIDSGRTMLESFIKEGRYRIATGAVLAPTSSKSSAGEFELYDTSLNDVYDNDTCLQLEVSTQCPLSERWQYYQQNKHRGRFWTERLETLVEVWGRQVKLGSGVGYLFVPSSALGTRRRYVKPHGPWTCILSGEPHCCI